MILILGLGNPGKEYELTRHNIGWRVLDEFAARHDFSPWQTVKKVKASVSRGKVGSAEVILLKPLTFMNKSGEAAAAALTFYKISVADLWVVHDDIAFPLGTVRISRGGSAGGHNGLDSVIEAVGTADFVRFRLGIAPITSGPVRLETFVLEKFAAGEAAALKATRKSTIEALDKALNSGIAAASQTVNSRR